MNEFITAPAELARVIVGEHHFDSTVIMLVLAEISLLCKTAPDAYSVPVLFMDDRILPQATSLNILGMDISNNLS